MRTDNYALSARGFPIVVVLAPAYLLLMAIMRDRVISFQTLEASLGIGVFGFLLAQLGRDEGKKLEPGLWREWGGAPTTQLLRHRQTVNATLLALWHSNIERITKVKMPTSAEEAADPVQADQRYAAAVSVLRDKTRDKSAFPLVFKENVSYGFRRNLVGLRPTGIVLSFGGTAACLWLALSNSGADSHLAWVGGAACALLFALWLIRFRASWIKPVAFAYGERLLETTGSL